VAQAVSGAAGIVVARAVLRDLVSGRELARLLSMLLLVSGMAPILAPMIGGQLLLVGGWRALFAVLAAFGAVLFLAVLAGLPDSLPPERRQRGGLARALHAYTGLLRDRVFLGYALAGGFSFGAMFAYISGSSFVYQQVFGISPQLYGVLFGLNSVGLLLAAQANGRLVRRVEPRHLLAVGQLGALASAALLVVGAVTSVGEPYGVLVPLFVTIATVGLVGPNAQALALARYPESAGTAAAVLGMTQFTVATLTGPLVTASSVRSAAPMAVVVAGSTAVGLVARLVLTRAGRTVQSTHRAGATPA
jgi:DHA1 family bicyclomycin/chloramphenicol resistance-like MFS transporter